jgi:hypothetical protein
MNTILLIRGSFASQVLSGDPWKMSCTPYNWETRMRLGQVVSNTYTTHHKQGHQNTYKFYQLIYANLKDVLEQSYT